MKLSKREQKRTLCRPDIVVSLSTVKSSHTNNTPAVSLQCHAAFKNFHGFTSCICLSTTDICQLQRLGEKFQSQMLPSIHLHFYWNYLLIHFILLSTKSFFLWSTWNLGYPTCKSQSPSLCFIPKKAAVPHRIKNIKLDVRNWNFS